MQLNPATADARQLAGTKLTCVGCSARFYDLNRVPARCPKCGAEQPPIVPRVAQSRPPAARLGRWRPAPVAERPAHVAEAAEEKDAVLEDPDADSEDSEPDTDAEPEEEELPD